MRHLLTLTELPLETLHELLDAAQALRPDALRRSTHRPLRGFTVANLFFEPSTRTRASFQLAAERLGADVVNFEAEQLVRFLQVTIGVMSRDQPTVDFLKQHDPALRNDLLLLLGNQQYSAISIRRPSLYQRSACRPSAVFSAPSVAEATASRVSR